MNNQERKELHEQLDKIMEKPLGSTHCVNATYYSKEDKGNFLYSLFRSDIGSNGVSDAPEHLQEAYTVLDAFARTITAALVNFIQLSESLGSYESNIDELKDENSILYRIVATAIEKSVELKEKKPVN